MSGDHFRTVFAGVFEYMYFRKIEALRIQNCLTIVKHASSNNAKYMEQSVKQMYKGCEELNIITNNLLCCVRKTKMVMKLFF